MKKQRKFDTGNSSSVPKLAPNTKDAKRKSPPNSSLRNYMH